MPDNDHLTRDRPKSSIQALLEERRGTFPVPDPDPASDASEESLPRSSEGYRAHSRLAAKPRPTLRLLLRDGSIRGFPYHNLDAIDYLPSDEPGLGPAIVLRFAGLVPIEARIEGRNLDALHDRLGEQRIGWVRELSGRDFLDEADPVVTQILLKTWEP